MSNAGDAPKVGAFQVEAARERSLPNGREVGASYHDANHVAPAKARFGTDCGDPPPIYLEGDVDRTDTTEIPISREGDRAVAIDGVIKFRLRRGGQCQEEQQRQQLRAAGGS